MGEWPMKAGRYSGVAAGAVVLAAAAAMLIFFALGQGSFEPLTGLPPSDTVAGYGHTGAAKQIDINTASAEQLTTLPGIGPARAADIVAWREENGPFRYPEELIRVEGIGTGTLEQILDLITTGGD